MGSRIASLLHLHGFLVECPWNPSGLAMESLWHPQYKFYGICLESKNMLYAISVELLMESPWYLNGISMVLTLVIHGIPTHPNGIEIESYWNLLEVSCNLDGISNRISIET